MKPAATPHPYQSDPDLPDTCVCGRPDPKRVNRIHQMPGVPRDVVEAEARRVGEAPE